MTPVSQGSPTKWCRSLSAVILGAVMPPGGERRAPRHRYQPEPSRSRRKPSRACCSHAWMRELPAGSPRNSWRLRRPTYVASGGAPLVAGILASSLSPFLVPDNHDALPNRHCTSNHAPEDTHQETAALRTPRTWSPVAALHRLTRFLSVLESRLRARQSPRPRSLWRSIVVRSTRGSDGRPHRGYRRHWSSSTRRSSVSPAR